MERDYKELKECEICSKAFGVLRIRHKCKRCNLIVCDKCCNTKAIILGYQENPPVPHKVCTYCRLDLDFQKNIKDTKKTNWATLSEAGREWIAKTNVLNELSLNADYDYHRYLEESEKNEDVKRLLEDLFNDLSQGRADREAFNYSILEYIHYAQGGSETKQHRKNVENVLRAFYARYQNQGYVSQLINIVMILLCFCDEKTAFFLLCYLNEKVVPPQFWDVHASPISFVGLLKEKYIIETATREVLNKPGFDIKLFTKTFKKLANVMIGGLMADVVNFSTVYTVWDEMFSTRSFKPVKNAILKVLKLSKKYYEQYAELTLYNYRLYVCRNIQGSNLQNDKVVPLTEETQARLSQEFDDVVLNKILAKQETLGTSMKLLRDLIPDDLNTISVKIGEVVQKLRAEKKVNISFAFLTQPTFIGILKATSSLGEMDEKVLEDIFKCLDYYEDGVVSSKLMAGLLILLINGDLSKKLDDFFTLFDASGQKKLTASDMPNILAFLGDVLTILNEQDPSYLNFHVHLYEMTEKLRKKVKKMENITPQDFQLIVAKYPVFNIVTKEEKSFQKRSDSVVSFISMNESALSDEVNSDDEERKALDFEDLPQGEVLIKDHEDASPEAKIQQDDSPVKVNEEAVELMSPEKTNDEQSSAHKTDGIIAMSPESPTKEYDFEVLPDNRKIESLESNEIILKPEPVEHDEAHKAAQSEGSNSEESKKTDDEFVKVGSGSDHSEKKEHEEPVQQQIVQEPVQEVVHHEPVQQEVVHQEVIHQEIVHHQEPQQPQEPEVENVVPVHYEEPQHQEVHHEIHHEQHQEPQGSDVVVVESPKHEEPIQEEDTEVIQEEAQHEVPTQDTQPVNSSSSNEIVRQEADVVVIPEAQREVQREVQVEAVQERHQEQVKQAAPVSHTPVQSTPVTHHHQAQAPSQSKQVIVDLDEEDDNQLDKTNDVIKVNMNPAQNKAVEKKGNDERESRESSCKMCNIF